MNAHDLEGELERILTEKGLSDQKLSLKDGVDFYLQFYRDYRADNCSIEEDGDMLLYSWGDKLHSGLKTFYVDLTRQFVLTDSDPEGGDENIWQMSLCFLFSWSELFDEIQSGNKWCPEPRPRAVDYFEGFIHQSTAYLAAHVLVPSKIELDYSNVG